MKRQFKHRLGSWERKIIRWGGVWKILMETGGWKEVWDVSRLGGGVKYEG